MASVLAFTVFYSWRAGLGGSLVTDGGQMILAAILLGGILIFLVPGFAGRLEDSQPAPDWAGWPLRSLSVY